MLLSLPSAARPSPRTPRTSPAGKSTLTSTTIYELDLSDLCSMLRMSSDLSPPVHAASFS
ncbi:hypothetical protein K523DRAFT_323153 [Schizophyllum commune Tattone D]|nr:hypothetical protein K523DRAFT_323153 [Schizophyllum commune Tattone D]